MFSAMLSQLGEKVSFILLRTVIKQNSAEKMEQQPTEMKEVHESPVNLLSGQQEENSMPAPEKPTTFTYGNQPVNPADPNTWGKIARNDPCPCGSGKKYKHCHGKI